MRIASVEAIPVAYPEPNDHGAIRNLCLCKLTADDGQVGWGEAVTMWPEASNATRVIVEEGFAPLLVGRDPVENEAIWHALKEHQWWYGFGGIAAFAISAVDIALWDLKGKALGARVVDLLGGPVRERLPAMACGHVANEDLAAEAELIGEWLAPGLHGVKMGYGKRGNARLGYEHDRDVEFVRLVREAIGPDKAIMVDLGAAIRWDVTTAVERTLAMEEHGLAWIEEPLGADDPEGYATLRAKTTTRIAYGERKWNARGFQSILEQGDVDVVGCDPGRAEGITGFVRVCREVDRARRQANAHAWSSAIVSAASLAVSFSQPACRSFEVKPLRNPMQHDLVGRPLDPVDGWMLPPQGPGLGIEVSEEVVDFYRLGR